MLLTKAQALCKWCFAAVALLCAGWLAWGVCIHHCLVLTSTGQSRQQFPGTVMCLNHHYNQPGCAHISAIMAQIWSATCPNEGQPWVFLLLHCF